MSEEKFSYSKLSVFHKCPYQFKLRYEDKNFSSNSSLALEIGTIAHKCKELIALSLIADKPVDYDYAKEVLLNGYKAENSINEKDHGVEYLPGVNALKQKYAFDWIEPDNKSGLTYNQKVDVFLEHLQDMENDPVWHPKAVEVPFSFDFEGYVISGFIDKVDEDKEGNLRVVDYKTSKAIYPDSEIKTAMQMVIYDLAIQNLYGKIPIEHMYDFVFIGKTQLACSKGYESRGRKKLQNWFAGIEACRNTGEYKPSPSPLCHWCDYCVTNANSSPELKGLCPYHSLWTPTNKTYEVAKTYKKADSNSQGFDKTFWF